MGNHFEYDFVQLNRTFHELSQVKEGDDFQRHPLFRQGKELVWPDLIAEYRVVVLSEAGSGKTEEIRHVAQDLRSQGKAAFFLRLEHVARDFEIAFEEGSFEEFQTWTQSTGEAWFLLDSIDEARLRDPGDFEAAIRQLSYRLSAHKQRAHIVMTGRTSTWRPKTDLMYCAKHLPFTQPSVSIALDHAARSSINPVSTKKAPKDNIPAFKIVALDDLSPDQIASFANARGVTNTKAFLDAIERAEAWWMTSRPQDLEEVLEFWSDYGRIGSSLELMRNSIARRLRERDQDRAEARPLSADRARLGATLLAAASTMTQDPTVRVPDGADNTKGLAIASVLTGWTEMECATLLSRPIFDEAIYGTVRFHHRSVREYLTAEWFADLLKRQTSRWRIENLFFRQQYGLEVIVPSMRPILPWLVLLDEKIRERVQKIAPELFFEGGDPSQLPLETRRQILHQVCEQMASGARSRTLTDYAAFQRFASVDLVADVKWLIERHADDDDLLWFLLRMVWQGELTDALPEAKRAALSPSSKRYTRISAFRAVAAIGSPEDNAEIRRTFLNESERLDREWLAELLKHADPSTETVTWLFECIQKVEDKNPHTVDHLVDQIIEFISRADEPLLIFFVELVNDLLAQAPLVERRHCEISERFGWLLEPAGVAVQRSIQAKSASALQVSSLSVLQKLPVWEQYRRPLDTTNPAPKYQTPHCHAA